jgi:hypothetical protein
VFQGTYHGWEIHPLHGPSAEHDHTFETKPHAMSACFSLFLNY